MIIQYESLLKIECSRFAKLRYSIAKIIIILWRVIFVIFDQTIRVYFSLNLATIDNKIA